MNPVGRANDDAEEKREPGADGKLNVDDVMNG